MCVFRRKIVAYAVSMALGIISADVLINRRKIIISLVIVAVVMFSLWAVARIRRGLESRGCSSTINREMIICAIVFAMGMLNLSINHVYQKPITSCKLEKHNAIEGQAIRYKEDDKGIIIDVETDTLGRRTVIRCRKWQSSEKAGDRGDSVNRKRGGAIRCTETASRNLYGRKVRVEGQIEIPETARNPGCFDYRRYLQTKRITHMMKASRIKVFQDRDKAIVWKARRRLQVIKESFAREASSGKESVYGFIKGVTYGDTGDIDNDTIKEFRENTTAHVLAVSGLHVGVIYGMLRLMAMGRHGGIVGIVTIIVMLGYGEVTAWNVSTTRAVLLTCTAILAFYLKRPFDLSAALATSFIALLIYNPYLLFGAGFQMSFLAVAGIAFLCDPLGRLIGKSAGFILSIQLVMVPYTVYTFNKINPIGFLVNIPIVGLISLLVPFAIGGLIVFLFTGSAGFIIKSVMYYLIRIVLKLNHLLNMNGCFSYSARSHKVAIVLAAYAVLFFVCSEFGIVMILRRKYRTLAVCMMLITLVSVAVGFAYRNPFLNDEIVFVDVGQGDGIHIRTDRYDMLIDGGGDIKKNIGEKVLKEYFLKNGINDLDMSLFTHMHTDHCKGAMELGEVFPVKKYVIPYPYRNEVSGGGVKMIGFRDKIQLSKEVWIEAIWPMDDRTAKSGDDDNELNTVYIVHYDGVKVMITGDLVEQDELDMVKYYNSSDVLKCDILKVAHHGSRYSSTEDFISAVSPKIAVIQVGKHNTYGHPNPGIIRRLRRHGAAVYRNDKQGAIGIDINRDRIRIDRMIEDVI